MVAIELKLYKVTAKGRDYFYAWRGGPRVKGEPGTPEFMLAYNEAIANHRIPDRKTFKSVIVRYRASPDYQKLAASTKKNWSPWLDKIDDYFGKLTTRQFDRPDKIRPAIRKWRGKYAATPRTADYGMQVLSRVLAYAVDPLGEIGANPCEGLKQLYSSSRAEIIWTNDDIATMRPHCSADVARAMDLAAHTGLRLGDLVKLSWSHVGADAIIMRTGKSGGTREAIVPLYDDLRALLGTLPRRSTAVLTNSFGRPWHKDGLGSRFADAKNKAWPEGTDLHFHDLRGTAVTKFYLGGLSVREIAEMFAWEEETVDRIIRRYVSRTAAIVDRIRRINEARKT